MSRPRFLRGAASPRRKPQRSRAGVTALALVTGLLLLVLPGPAAAGERSFRVGVMEGPLDPPADIATMGRAGVQTLRTVFSWRNVEQDGVRPGTCPNPATGYSWGQYDRMVVEASRNGVQLLPVILGSPEYVSSTPLRAPNTGQREIENYKCFVRELVERYGRGGEFVAGRPIRPVTQWQVWNEPNLKKYSAKKRVRPKEYARLLKLTYNQIRREDGRATVVMAGLPEQTLQSMAAGPFLRKFYTVRRIEQRFDVLALHPYAANYRGVEGAMIRLRGVLRDVGDRSRYVWITEVGWGTGGNDGSLSFLQKTEGGQARQLRKTFGLLRSNRRRFNVGTVTWFRWQDTARTNEITGPFEHAGLFRRNGTPKPSCDEFVKFTGGICTPIPGAATATVGSALLEPRPAASEAAAPERR